MVAYFFIVFGSLFFLTGSALLALRWAARTGQLRHFQKTALSIFDEEEPVGQMTDAFPGKVPRATTSPREPFGRSTDLESAVSRIYNPHDSECSVLLVAKGAAAESNSARRQIPNLRYHAHPAVNESPSVAPQRPSAESLARTRKS
jgi:hypothetical protein